MYGGFCLVVYKQSIDPLVMCLWYSLCINVSGKLELLAYFVTLKAF